MATWVIPERRNALLFLSTVLLLKEPADASESALLEVFSLGLTEPEVELGQWEGYCRSGSFGARERWIIETRVKPFVTLQPQYKQERGSRKPVKGDFTFVNLDRRNVLSQSPPCYEMTKKLLQLQMAQLSSTEDRYDEQLGLYVLVGVRSPFSHSCTWQGDAYSYAAPEALYDQANEDGTPAPLVTIEQGEHTGLKTDLTFSFAFQSCIDTIDAVARLLKQEAISIGTVRALLNDSGQIALDQLMQEERDVLVLLPSSSLEASWTNSFSLEDWELLRQKTPDADRKALATSWTDLTNYHDLREGDEFQFAMRVNCVRRALAWYPGFVPSYLVLSSSLAQSDARCQLMEKILEHADPAEFHSTEMRSVLTTHFPQCSTVLRMANLWETNACFRYLVAFSIVFSTIRGIWIMVSFVQDYSRWYWRKDKQVAK